MSNNVVDKNIVDSVKQVLSGNKTGQQNRADNNDLNCVDICPGGQQPTALMKAAVVTLSPNSPGLQAGTSTPPANLGVSATAFQTVLRANTNRSEVIIQNNGTTVIKLVLGPSTLSPSDQTHYHIALAASNSADDGSGGTFVSDLWKGDIQALSDSAGGTILVTELTP